MKKKKKCKNYIELKGAKEYFFSRLTSCFISTHEEIDFFFSLQPFFFEIIDKSFVNENV